MNSYQNPLFCAQRPEFFRHFLENLRMMLCCWKTFSVSRIRSSFMWAQTGRVGRVVKGSGTRAPQTAATSYRNPKWPVPEVRQQTLKECPPGMDFAPSDLWEKRHFRELHIRFVVRANNLFYIAFFRSYYLNLASLMVPLGRLSIHARSIFVVMVSLLMVAPAIAFLFSQSSLSSLSLHPLTHTPYISTYPPLTLSFGQSIDLSLSPSLLPLPVPLPLPLPLSFSTQSYYLNLFQDMYMRDISQHILNRPEARNHRRLRRVLTQQVIYTRSKITRTHQHVSLPTSSQSYSPRFGSSFFFKSTSFITPSQIKFLSGQVPTCSNSTCFLFISIRLKVMGTRLYL